MNFFFGGIVKNKVYEKNPKTINELKDYIHETFRKIEICAALCDRVFWTDVRNVGGGHFEHLRD